MLMTTVLEEGKLSAKLEGDIFNRTEVAQQTGPVNGWLREIAVGFEAKDDADAASLRERSRKEGACVRDAWGDGLKRR